MIFSKDSPFSFINSVGDTFSKAVEAFKIGSEILGKSREGSDNRGFIDKHRFSPMQAAQRPMYPQRMQEPIGLRAPSMKMALRYYADNPAADVNFQSIRTQSYKAQPPKYTSTKPTTTLTDANTLTGRKKTVKVSGVMAV